MDRINKSRASAYTPIATLLFLFKKKKKTTHKPLTFNESKIEKVSIWGRGVGTDLFFSQNI